MDTTKSGTEISPARVVSESNTESRSRWLTRNELFATTYAPHNLKPLSIRDGECKLPAVCLPFWLVVILPLLIAERWSVPIINCWINVVEVWKHLSICFYSLLVCLCFEYYMIDLAYIFALLLNAELVVFFVCTMCCLLLPLPCTSLFWDFVFREESNKAICF